MDRKEAQFILSALRPDAPEANEPLFAEALALAESDPELRSWWRAQQEFDRRVAVKLAGVPCPEDLRDHILAAPKIVAFPPQWRHGSLLAAAAVVALLCVAGTFWHAADSNPAGLADGGGEAVMLNRADFAGQVLHQLEPSGPELAMTSPDYGQVAAWLRARNAPVGDMPAKFAATPSVGCQKYLIQGHAVSLICFALANGGVAHLFMIDKRALNDPPSSEGPQFDQMKGWNIAAWSDDHMSYILATQSSLDNLKQMFSAG